MVVVAPDSRATTWQMGQRSSGRDAGFIDRLLAHVSDRVSIDPERVAVGGFSDGASYALELGLANGDLFHRVIAFSPGILAAAPPHGRPRVFVSHGTADTILPIDRCSRVFVPMLRRVGYDVEYVEFDGGHQVPAAIRARALAWLGWAPPPAPPSVPQRPDIGIATSLIR
jgi:phospholipase/carboxylesterase